MRMQRLVLCGLIIGHVFGVIGLPSMAIALGQTVLISEVQMGGAASGHSSDEFIELYNPTDTAVSLSKWLVQYRAASAGSDCTKNWTTKATLTGTIPSHGYYLLAATGYLSTADGRFSAGLAQTAAAIRLVDGGSLAVDALAWGSGTPCGKGTSSAAPLAGQSLERKPGDDQPLAGNGIDSSDNSSDFVVRTSPEPQLTTSSVEVSMADEIDPGVDDAPVSLVAYLPLQINELMVDPVSPQSDDQNEFVEIYNPNPEPVDANGYVLQWSDHTYHLPHNIIPAGGYTQLTSADSPISLTNSGGSMSLLDPLGQTIGAAVTWPAAIPGATWSAGDNDAWSWSTTPTPGAANVMTAPIATTSAPATTGVPEGISNTSQVSPIYSSVLITELLPDPAAPASDDNDEFVELYNPGPTAIDLTGYIIKSGSSLGNSSTIDAQMLEPGQYLAIMSSSSHLPLANGGGRVEVLDPLGALASNEVSYETAKSGQAYAKFDDGWYWTTTLTPNAPNVLTASTVASASTTAAAKPKAAAKASTPTKKSATPPKAAAKPKASAAKAAKKPTAAASLVAAAKASGGNWLLIGLAGLTIAYIIYEFRHDLRNAVRFRRRHRLARSAPRSEPTPAPLRVAPRPRINW